MTNLRYKKFSTINLSDPFFASLKADYVEFPHWFEKKADAGQSAYTYETSNKISGFLYLKIENAAVLDIDPPLPSAKHLKVGTLKIDAHGTKLGERFIKKVFDHAIHHEVDDAYVTVFEKHDGLVKLLNKYGFAQIGKKSGANGVELVLLKKFTNTKADILIDYPRINANSAGLYLLAIYPEYHTRFLPDSKLKNESFEILEDVSHANSIHKIYISGVGATNKLLRGDLLLMYRTTDRPGHAKYRSVATSIGVVEEIRRIGSFVTEKDFMKYVRPYSVFETKELATRYATKKNHNVIRFTYNVALPKRIIRLNLIDQVGLPGTKGRRWDFLKLTKTQLNKILELGEVNEGYFIN